MKPRALTLETPKKDFLKITDVEDRILNLLRTALDLKTYLGKNGTLDAAKGKSLGMIFEKPSTRTRVSFEVGMKRLGGQVVVLNADELQLGHGETIRDTAKVLSRYLDVVMYRAFKADDMRQLAAHSTIPVINGLDDEEHPCQILADFLSLSEHFGRLKGLEFCYVGDGDNNVAHSYLLGAPLVGMNLRILSPPAYQPGRAWLARAHALAEKHGTRITVGTLSNRGLLGADVIATDTWVSMGDESEERARRVAFKGYTIDESTLLLTRKPGTVFLHCLPAHYGQECTEALTHGPQSLVFEEAENRLWAQLALLVDLLGLQEEIAPLIATAQPTVKVAASQGSLAAG